MQKIIDAFLYWGLRLLVCILGALPWEMRKEIGFLLGKGFARLPTKDRLVTMRQLDLFLPDQGGRKLLSMVYGNMGRTIMESFNLSPVLHSQSNKIICEDEKLLKLVATPPSGVVALTAHIGNWDLLAAYLIKRGVPLVPIGREARIPVFQRLLVDLRQRYGIKTIWRTNKLGVKEIIHCLKQRKVVAGLIDQDTRVSSIMVPFFGRAASVPVGLVDLAKRYNCLILSGFIVRHGDQYRVHIYSIDANQTAFEILQQFHSQLEAIIRRYPCQWVWNHKRWRTLESGRRLSSREYRQALEDNCW